MIKVHNTVKNRSEVSIPISLFLDEQIKEPRIESYGDDQTYFEAGNFLPLLKLITEKLHAAKMISDQELLETLGGGYEWCSPYFKADE
jgi:hypothetical protein